MIEPLQISDEERDVLVPRDKPSVAEYAVQERMLSGKAGTRFHGKWSHSICPYQVEPMESMTMLGISEVHEMKGAQVAGSEIGFNLFARTLQYNPGLTIIAMPTQDDTKDRIKRLFRPTIQIMPSLRKHLPGGNLSNINVGEATEFDNMLLFLVWAGSPAQLADKPSPVIIADEIGKWPTLAGREADPMNLLRARQTTYRGVSILYAPSTPVMQGDIVERCFEEGDQRKYWVACVFCGCRFVLRWEYVHLERDSVGKILTEEHYADGGDECSWFFCPHCEKKWSNTDRWTAVSGGIYAPRGCKVEGDKVIGKVFRNPKRSYHIPGFLLHPAFTSAPLLAAQWSAAEKAWQKGDRGPRQHMVNSVFAEGWYEPGQQAEADVIRLRVSDEFSAHTVPTDVQIITCGGDYHLDEHGNERIDYVIVGWASSIRSYDLIVGRAPSWEHFENEVFGMRLPWADGDLDRPELTVLLAAIDSGFMSHIVYEFCDKWSGRAIPLKGGRDGQSVPVKRTPIKPESKTRKSRRIVKPGTLYTFDPLIFKDKVYDAITKEQIDGPGSARFYAECPQWYTKQICNEHRVKTTSKGGRITYNWKPVKEHAECHGLDIRVAATVAGYLLGVEHLRPQTKTAPAKQPTSRKSGSGFLDNTRTIRS